MSEQTPNPDKAWRVEHDEGTGAPVVVSQCRDIARVENSFGDGETHAVLIAEAGTVWQQTGLSPQQLARDRAELLEALQSLADGLVSVYRSAAPMANTELGNRFADSDPNLIQARAVLSKQRTEEAVK